MFHLTSIKRWLFRELMNFRMLNSKTYLQINLLVANPENFGGNLVTEVVGPETLLQETSPFSGDFPTCFSHILLASLNFLKEGTCSLYEILLIYC